MSNAGSLRELLGNEGVMSPLKPKKNRNMSPKKYKKRKSLMTKKLGEVQEVVKYEICSCLCKRKKKDLRKIATRSKRKDYKVNKYLKRAVSINLSYIENDALNEKM